LLSNALGSLAAYQDIINVLFLDSHFESAVLLSKDNRKLGHEVPHYLFFINFVFYCLTDSLPLLVVGRYDILGRHNFETFKLGLLKGERKHLDGLDLLFGFCLFFILRLQTHSSCQLFLNVAALSIRIRRLTDNVGLKFFVGILAQRKLMQLGQLLGGSFRMLAYLSFSDFDARKLLFNIVFVSSGIGEAFIKLQF
jgi:hypothetical protein